MITLNETEAVALLKEIVERDGRDYVNPKFIDPSDGVASCVYFLPDGAPSCGVGHILAAKGITGDMMTGDQNHLGSMRLFEELRDAGIMEVSSPAQTILSRFQMTQDQDLDNTWGEALDYALMWSPNED
jgi:hypothetical protein